jgi:uncharacterized Zn finger protein
VRENAEYKARRYLGEGWLTVEQVSENLVRATCRGSGAIYDVGWTAKFGWSCSCPCLSRRCAHLLALQLITVRKGSA